MPELATAEAVHVAVSGYIPLKPWLTPRWDEWEITTDEWLREFRENDQSHLDAGRHLVDESYNRHRRGQGNHPLSIEHCIALFESVSQLSLDLHPMGLEEEDTALSISLRGAYIQARIDIRSPFVDPVGFFI